MQLVLGLFTVAALRLVLPASCYYFSELDDPDIILGGLFPVHKNYDGTCGDVLDLGIQRLEAMVLALNMVNDDPTLLPGLRVGFDIRDTCTQPDIALQSSLDFIVGLDSAMQEDEDDNSTTMMSTVGVSGVVGSASSSESISAASLLRLFQTPQISYASTARILSDKTRYDYFFRTLPPDVFQARVMVQLVLHYNWTYVIAINSDDVYGREGIAAFVNELDALSSNTKYSADANNSKTFCVASAPIPISVTASDEEFDDVVRHINEPWVSNSSVVVLFGQLATAEGLLQALSRWPNHRPLTFIVSDAVGNNLHYTFYSMYHTMISVLPEYRESEEFNEYFTSLKPGINRNPWFCEYWELVFSCSFNHTSNNSVRSCDDLDQSLSNNNYQQNSKVPFVLDAVYAFAHAIHNMLSTVCGNITICDKVRVERYGRYVINGELLLLYLHNVSFNGFSTDKICFDSNGDQPGGYWINNLQYISGKYEFVRIAEWNINDNLIWNQHPMYWGMNTTSEPLSFCSYPCTDGHMPVIVKNEASCCWECEVCLGARDVSTGQECFSCGKGFSPNNNRSGCEENPLSYLRWKDTTSVFILFVTLIGLICTSVIAAVFILFHNHEIIKASSRELSAVLLCGLFLCFFIPFFSIGEPTEISCTIHRFLFGFSFSLCYAALLVKTNRIHRIFNRSLAKSSQRPALISPQIQIFFTLVLVFVQIVITVAWLVVEQPGTKYIYHDESTELTCNYSPFIAVVISLGYNLILLIICAYFAFRTRKIPQNFNEARVISVALFALLITWIAFIPVYIAVQRGGTYFTVVFQSFSIVLSAFTTLCSLFFPKLYYIFSAKRKEISSTEKPNGHVEDSIIDKNRLGSLGPTSQHFYRASHKCSNINIPGAFLQATQTTPFSALSLSPLAKRSQDITNIDVEQLANGVKALTQIKLSVGSASDETEGQIKESATLNDESLVQTKAFNVHEDENHTA